MLLRTLYLLSVWLHILAAIAWIGAMFFLMFVVVPWMRSTKSPLGPTLLRETGPRLRSIGWICFGIVAVTGTFNLWMRGIRFGNFFDPQWIGSSYGQVVTAKILVFLLVVAVSARHDFVIGPKATEAIAKDPRSAEAEAFRRKASSAGRLNAMLALLLVALAVMIVRGPLW